ncbi:hypothetical protein SDC9_154138 [bioreactor metagenome]|uniref:Amidohydrolase-related domain-containing protein n=1 Tax=bioreactor metagenome TaxID=1076179 RepID=A0A645EXY7_9ZZZZ
MPQSIGELIDICDASDGRFVPFCNLDPRVLSNSSDTDLGFLLEYYKQKGCVGMGEVLPLMAFDDPYMQNLFYHCQKVGFPLLFDLSASQKTGYGIYDDPGLPRLRHSLEKFPQLLFIGHGPAFWSELGELHPGENRRSYLHTAIEKEGAVIKLMRDYKNLAVDLSAGSGYYAMTRDRDFAASFINEFSDRIMFGTDICFAAIPHEILNVFLKELASDKLITTEKYEAVMHKNAERLLGI